MSPEFSKFDTPQTENSLPVVAPGELLALGSPYALEQIERLFEADSPLLQQDPYALSAPPNTVKARRADWRVFCAFCRERHFTPLPASVPVLRAFWKPALPGMRPNPLPPSSDTSQPSPMRTRSPIRPIPPRPLQSRARTGTSHAG